MSIWEILLIGVALSMDALAVSLTNGMIYKNEKLSKKLASPLFFGVFQGVMPILGFFASSLFVDVIEKYSGIVSLVILVIIGAKMIKDGACPGKKEKQESPTLTFKMLLLQAFATSIDAFAVGVGFCVSGANIYLASPIIAYTTFVISLAAIYIGKKFGDLLGGKAQILGGAVLVVIGIKSVL